MSLIRDIPAPEAYVVIGHERYNSAYAVSELANASFAAVGQELAALIQAMGLSQEVLPVCVDQRLASLWFGYSFAPQGWELPSLWDPIAGNYACRDGWIRLHTNLPHHRAAALKVLGCAASPDAVRVAVRDWDSGTLETEIVDQDGVAAAMRSRADWMQHPQGQALAAEPLIHWDQKRPVALRPNHQATQARPLQGLRVLDLTRVLAGPVATRTLAGFGADVLRIDPPGWDEPGVIQDISLGKSMTFLDLQTAEGRARFEALLAQADVLVHGYRPGALDGLGYDLATRDRLAPNRVEVSLNAYGWTGPWSGRRGFDSLVQMSAGIADTGRIWAKADKPTPLPVQALDHATGYLMAAAVLSALRQALTTGETQNASLSLARTANLLAEISRSESGSPLQEKLPQDYDRRRENSDWGPALRLKSALSIGSTYMHWNAPARACGTSEAYWPRPRN
ncbi:Formyl-coenzyme A transferase [Phaeobacter sp. CECT 5382]|uniref:CoA transferase n=1 Tax=Phaeobacter sp. CECT 5382 TaxID=1712645 RepID=UPI0006DA3A8D|nr:CoA transferase [Phaeobacter sp. CECT 5382]CUH88943.1 Formyl-coenzyme A transferase [Phaeobacter sp. CECT 5382]